MNEVGFAVLDFVERRCFGGGAPDVGELIVVIDGGDAEGLARRLGIQHVVELQLRSVG